MSTTKEESINKSKGSSSHCLKTPLHEVILRGSAPGWFIEKINEMTDTFGLVVDSVVLLGNNTIESPESIRIVYNIPDEIPLSVLRTREAVTQFLDIKRQSKEELGAIIHWEDRKNRRGHTGAFHSRSSGVEGQFSGGETEFYQLRNQGYTPKLVFYLRKSQEQ